jgi:UPF0755 protein
MNKFLKIGLAIIAVAATVTVIFGGKYIKNNCAVADKKFVYIKTGSSFENIIENLQTNQILVDANSFATVAKQMGLQNSLHAGRYEFKSGMSNYTMVKMLRSGDQKPVQLVLKKYRTQKDLASHIGSKLECDSSAIMALLNNNAFLQQRNLDSLTSLAAFTPNTYEFYWNTTAEKVFEKIEKQYNKFWNDDRKKKASNLNLRPAQVMTLASIVEEETNAEPEKGNVASVYLNRLAKGMKLQADPTVKYALGDFAIRRVLLKHLTYPSPYNTYYAAGLPPGPICTPSTSSIEAVLNAPKTNYIFFCASPDKVGYHNFAATNAEHDANAKKFQEWLDKRGIKH